MFNDNLAKDYLRRAGARLRAIEVLFAEESWADVVRESQEVVEITLKALLRESRVEVPRIHDVSPVLQENEERLPSKARDQLAKMMSISKALRRDRELAFYGSEDLTPSDFYTEDDARKALDQARWIHDTVSSAVGELRDR
jgi:HEPN domain-containing protein